ncbi:hypothetical protein K474DRAFT_480617 [Panus rudis PR-1116 ss-1]|nr:hypothetical protein K474DRAFT_480617 [Panus rudis PR-1116 ss-1]
MIPILKKGNVSLEKLEFLFVRSFYILRDTRDLIRRCSGSLRELHLVSALSSNPSSTLDHSPDDISLSSLRGIRRLYCESLALPDIIHILSTLPRPSTLTHLQLSISLRNLDVDNLAWRDLDAMLTSPAFPALCCVSFDLWYVLEDEFVRNLRAGKGWLRGCFGREIVRYGGDYESFNDMYVVSSALIVY